MPLVHIPLRHRADRPTHLEALGFSLSLAVIDTEPRTAQEDAVDGGCASCSLVSFLESRSDLARYRGLAQILHALKRFETGPGGRETAWDTAKSGSLYRVAPRTRNAGDRVVHVDNGDDRPWPEFRPGDAVLIRPDGHGPQRMLARLQGARKAGADKILLGYVRHADATDHFPPFVEHPDLAAGWLSVVAQARQLGVSRLGFAMAYPPCAALQWSHNRELESLRARLDQQFRRLDEEASMMCPENVSGYSLLNDTREALAGVPVAASRFAIRTENALFVYGSL